MESLQLAQTTPCMVPGDHALPPPGESPVGKVIGMVSVHRGQVGSRETWDCSALSSSLSPARKKQPWTLQVSGTLCLPWPGPKAGVSS